MHLQESGEMYLETILILSQKNKFVRSLDVAEYMGFSKPSVSIALKQLENNGFISRDKDGLISLTDDGRQIAESVYERHELLTRHFISIGVSPDTAREDACRVEHYISQETFDALKKHHMRDHN